MTQNVNWLEFSIYPSKIKNGDKIWAKGKIHSTLDMSVELKLEYEKPTPPIPHDIVKIIPTTDRSTWIRTFDQVSFIPNDFYPAGIYRVMASYGTTPWQGAPPSFEIV